MTMSTVRAARSRRWAKRRRRGLPIVAATLREKRTGLTFVCAYIVFIVFLVAGVLPMYEQMDIASFLENPAFAAFMGMSGLETFEGFSAFLAMEFYGVWYGIIFGCVVAYFAGSTIAHTVEDGSIDLILSRPMSRTRYYMERWSGILIIIAITSVVALFCVYICTIVFSGVSVNWKWMLLTQLTGTIFLLFVSAAGMLVSSFINSSRSAGGAAIGIIFFSYVLNIAGTLVTQWPWVEKLSPFYYAPMVRILVAQQITWWHLPALLGIGLVLGLTGLIIFNRRDIAA